MENKNIDIGHSYKIIIFSIAYGLGFYYLKVFSKQNSWLIVIISTILGFLFIKMITTIKNSHKEKSIYEINKFVLGKVIGTGINIIFSLTFILLSAIILWYLLIFLKTNFLAKTPIILIGVISILPLFYIANKNSKVLIKSNVIFSFIIFALTIITIIFLLPQNEINNLKPFEEVSIDNMLYALFSFTSITYLPTYLIVSIYNKSLINFKKHFVKVLLLLLSITLSTFLVLGNSIVEMVDFPQFFVLRKIGLLANGTRIDSLIIIGWILSIYTINASSILFIRNYLKSEINNYKNIYTYLIIILIFILSLNIFKNVTIGKLFILKVLPFILFSVLFLINFIVFLLIKKKPKMVSHE